MRAGTKIPLEPLQASLLDLGVKPATTKLIRTDVADWTHEQFHEDVYVSMPRPRQRRARLARRYFKVAAAFAEQLANVRLETYAGNALPPASQAQ